MRDTPRAQALLVVDVQVGWVEGPAAVRDAERLMKVLEDHIAAARQADALVVFLQDVGDLDSTVPQGSPGRELALTTEPQDVIVPKEVDDGFVGTGLEALLREGGVTSIAVAGIQSEMCVAATSRGALARGFTVILARDAHSTHDIPADGDGAAVPAAQVRRVAEWSLGDDLVVVDRARQVVFESLLPRHDGGGMVGR